MVPALTIEAFKNFSNIKIFIAAITVTFQVVYVILWDLETHGIFKCVCEHDDVTYHKALEEYHQKFIVENE